MDENAEPAKPLTSFPDVYDTAVQAMIQEFKDKPTVNSIALGKKFGDPGKARPKYWRPRRRGISDD